MLISVLAKVKRKIRGQNCSNLSVTSGDYFCRAGSMENSQSDH